MKWGICQFVAVARALQRMERHPATGCWRQTKWSVTPGWLHTVARLASVAYKIQATIPHYRDKHLPAKAKPLLGMQESVMPGYPLSVRTEDGKVFDRLVAKLVGSVSAVRSREVHRPAVVGEFPVMVEQSGDYRMFTYSKKIREIRDTHDFSW